MHYQLDKYDQQLQNGSQTKLSVTNTHTLIEKNISIENLGWEPEVRSYELAPCQGMPDH